LLQLAGDTSAVALVAKVAAQWAVWCSVGHALIARLLKVLLAFESSTSLDQLHANLCGAARWDNGERASTIIPTSQAIC
jgi:hypothetical protein